MYFSFLYFTILQKYYVMIFNNSQCGDDTVLPAYLKIV